MGVEESVRGWVVEALGELARAGLIPEAATHASFAVERPKRPEHGDLATNAALAIQKLAKKPPREIATALAERLKGVPGVKDVEIAGPGFLNLRLGVEPYHAVRVSVFGENPARKSADRDLPEPRQPRSSGARPSRRSTDLMRRPAGRPRHQ